MRHLLNTLYVTTQGAYLSRDGETVHVRVEHESKLRVPIHTISSVVCFGQVSCSPPLLELCAERNVTVSFLSQHGHFWARMEGPTKGNVLLRREQYRRADSSLESAKIARSIVAAKISNCRTAVLRAIREKGETTATDRLESAAARLAQLVNKIIDDTDLDTIRGKEGEAARVYFGVFPHFIAAQKEGFPFEGRNRRPPLDNMNALLSFLYTLLVHDITGALETVGLDPAVGFLHRERPGRPSLALDMMEEFRPSLADRLALSLINLQQIRPEGFTKTESGAVLMSAETRKEVLVAYQKRKQEEILHPFLQEKVAIGLLPYCQAMLMGRYLRGEIDGYPPFFWK